MHLFYSVNISKSPYGLNNLVYGCVCSLQLYVQHWASHLSETRILRTFFVLYICWPWVLSPLLLTNCNTTTTSNVSLSFTFLKHTALHLWATWTTTGWSSLNLKLTPWLTIFTNIEPSKGMEASKRPWLLLLLNTLRLMVGSRKFEPKWRVNSARYEWMHSSKSSKYAESFTYVVEKYLFHDLRLCQIFRIWL